MLMATDAIGARAEAATRGRRDQPVEGARHAAFAEVLDDGLARAGADRRAATRVVPQASDRVTERVDSRRRDQHAVLAVPQVRLPPPPAGSREDGRRAARHRLERGALA